MTDLVHLYNSLKEAFIANNYTKSNKLLSELKIGLLKSNLLLHNSSNEFGIIVRDSLEIGAYLSLFNRDLTGFSNSMTQLHIYYRDKLLPDSDRMYPLIGLELLRCLVEHQLAQFHVYLEWLPTDVILNNDYIKGPIALEQSLMEGSFHKAWLACSNANGPEYQYFMELMMSSLREELAKCFEKAHSSIPISVAANLLFCSSEKELAQLIQKRGWAYNKDDSKIYFIKPNINGQSLSTSEFPVNDLISKNLFYARELERII